MEWVISFQCLVLITTSGRRKPLSISGHISLSDNVGNTTLTVAFGDPENIDFDVVFHKYAFRCTVPLWMYISISGYVPASHSTADRSIELGDPENMGSDFGIFQITQPIA